MPGTLDFQGAEQQRAVRTKKEGAVIMTRKQFLFVDWEGGGNLPPALTIARRLIERGHTVRFLGEPCNREEIESTGSAFVSYVYAPHRDNKRPESDFIRDWEARTPFEAFARTRERLMFGPASAYAQDVLEELAAHPADAVAVDFPLFGALVGAEYARVPTAVLNTTVYRLPAPGLPPTGLGLLPAAGPFGRVRDVVLNAVVSRMFAQGLPDLNTARHKLGLAPLAHPFQQLGRADLFLVLTSPAFDFRASRLPPNVRYVGTQFDEPLWAQPWSSPWPANHPDPLVVVSLSTSFQQQGALLQRVMDALGGMQVRALVTLGPTLRQESFHAPENVVIGSSAPHGQVFPHASAVVTHAGHGTVMRALANGLPLVCIPMGRDQHDVAARVVARGAGLRLSQKASIPALRRAIQRVLDEPGFHAQARHLARAIAEETYRPLAAEALEELATLGRVHAPAKG
jgi:MGT family glycosyltransferase